MHGHAGQLPGGPHKHRGPMLIYMYVVYGMFFFNVHYV
jgi:hypothetical protein